MQKTLGFLSGPDFLPTTNPPVPDSASGILRKDFSAGFTTIGREFSWNRSSLENHNRNKTAITNLILVKKENLATIQLLPYLDADR